MDAIALLVFVGGFAVCAALVFMVFFSVKEQTYEEALALQRTKKKDRSKDRKKDGANKKKSQKWNKRKENGISPNDANHKDIAEVVETVYVEPEDLPISSEDELATVTEEVLQVAEELPQVTHENIQVKEKQTPQQNPLKNKKYKIDIKEVKEVLRSFEVVNMAPEEKITPIKIGSMVEVLKEEESTKPPIVKAETSQLSPNIAKRASKKQNGCKNGSNSKELLAILEKSVFNDLEAQQIIDVILNKQGDGLSLGGGGDWVEKGKLSETAKLQKQLGEAEVSLQEEVVKARSFKDKMVELRRELNEEKSAKATFSRTVEEMKTSHAQEINNLNIKLTVLQTQLNQQLQQQNQLEESGAHFQGIIDTLNLQLEQSQAHFQATIVSLNLQLEMSNVALGTASATAAGERDKSRALREEFEKDAAAMREQLMVKTDEAVKLGEVKRELEQVMASKAQLNSEVARLQTENSSLMAAKEKTMIVEKGLKDVTEKLEAKEAEMAKMERELDEIKLKIESESTADESFKNDLDVSLQKAEALEREIEELKLSQVGDCTLAELDVLSKKVKQLTMELDIKEKEILKLKSTTKVSNSSIDLLSRLFPNLDTTGSSDETEAAIKQHLAASLEARRNEDTEKLEAQVTHYKNTLDQTETMMTALQASVDEQEGNWIKKLEAATEELAQIKNMNGINGQDDNSSVKVKDSDTKFEELKKQLVKEKEEKEEALEKLAKLNPEIDQDQWNGTETKNGLVSSNALLSKLLMVGQQALEKETQSVNALKSQLEKTTGNAELTQL